MTQKIIAVVGVSGVGKSTFLRNLKDQVNFQHLQASEIITRQMLELNQVQCDSEFLRYANIDNNQALLVSGFKRLCDPEAQIVILDGHTVIDTPGGLVDIDSLVFQEIGIVHLVCLAENPYEIVRRRQADFSRSRPNRSLIQIEQYQNQAQIRGFQIALSLKIPFTILPSDCLVGMKAIL